MSLASFFFDMPSELMTAIGTVLGFALLGDLDADQENSLGNFLMLIAQIMITDATQKQLLESLASSGDQAAIEARLRRIEKALGLDGGEGDHSSPSSVD